MPAGAAAAHTRTPARWPAPPHTGAATPPAVHRGRPAVTHSGHHRRVTPELRILLAHEHLPGELRRRLRSGELTRLRRGAHLPRADGPDGGTPDPRSVAIAKIRATCASLRAPHVVSHASAALLWGLPLWNVPGATHVRQRGRAAGVHAADVVRHHGLPPAWAEIDGCPVTDLAATVLDCVTTMPLLDGLVVADAALARGIGADELETLLGASPRRNGRVRAATVLSLADGGAESAWETWLRYVALWAGLPRPVTQLPVVTHRGTVRVDLAWPAHHVLAEFDGAVKYVDGAFGARYDGRRALMEEKRREDAIAEALGVRPLRAVAADARDAENLARRLIARFPAEIRASIRRDRRFPAP